MRRQGSRFGRRNGARSGSSAPVGPTMDGIRASHNTGYLRTVANPGGIAGDAAGFYVAWLMNVSSQSVSSASRYVAARSAGSAGWQAFTSGTNGSLFFRLFSGAGAAVTKTHTITAGDVGKIIGFVGVHDGSNVRLYVNRVESGAAAAVTGYTAAAERTYVGTFSAGTGATADLPVIYGVGGGNGVPSLANIQAWFDAVKAGAAFVDMPSVAMQHRWPTSTLGTIADLGSAPENLETVGTTVVVNSGPITWGW